MGCDIHGPFIETKGFGRPGENIGGDTWWLRCEFDTDRNYALFGALAGVRSMDIIDYTEPKGFPEKMSDQWRQHHEKYGPDDHNASWLTIEELRKAGDLYREAYDEISHDIALWLLVMEHVSLTELKPVRIGFCFDN